jgi:isoleucyl-tRNA synthetase
LVNRIQNIRKEQNFDVTDNILVEIEKCEELCQAVEAFREYICSETLTKELKFVDTIENPLQTIDVIEGEELAINIRKA